jgi:hypothetical protein
MKLTGTAEALNPFARCSACRRVVRRRSFATPPLPGSLPSRDRRMTQESPERRAPTRVRPPARAGDGRLRRLQVTASPGLRERIIRELRQLARA